MHPIYSYLNAMNYLAGLGFAVLGILSGELWALVVGMLGLAGGFVGTYLIKELRVF